MRLRKFLVALLATTVSTLGLLAPASPAAAKPVEMWGFAYFDTLSPAGWVPLALARQWGSWKTAYPADVVTGAKASLGRYYVRFPHLASSGIGIPHVTAVDAKGHYCEVVRWFDAAADQIVEVACFKPGGLPDDSLFTVLFTVGSTWGYTVAPGGYAFLHYGPSGIVQEDNSSGTPNGAGQFGTGLYEVKLPGVADPAQKITGNLQVTAVSPPAKPHRCKVAKWGQSGSDVVAYVFCFDPLGNYADSEFTLSYHERRSVVATYPPKYFGYIWTPGPATASNFNNLYGYGANSFAPVIGPIGYSAIKFPGIGVRESHAQVTAYGDGPNYCNIAAPWTYSAPSTALLTVVCFDKAGNAARHDYFATFNSRF